jgi:hypothetical protein
MITKLGAFCYRVGQLGMLRYSVSFNPKFYKKITTNVYSAQTNQPKVLGTFHNVKT